MNYEWSKNAIDDTQKQLASDNLEEKAKGQTNEAEYRALVREVADIFNSYQRVLIKKAENAFKNTSANTNLAAVGIPHQSSLPSPLLCLCNKTNKLQKIQCHPFGVLLIPIKFSIVITSLRDF